MMTGKHRCEQCINFNGFIIKKEKSVLGIKRDIEFVNCKIRGEEKVHSYQGRSRKCNDYDLKTTKWVLDMSTWNWEIVQ